MLRRLIPLALFALSAPALADAPAAPAAQAQTLQQQVEATLATAPQGTRFGLLVVDEAGKVVVQVNPDQRFMPASNTKMFTTAAAYALLPGMDKPDTAGGTEVALVPKRDADVFDRNGGAVPGLGPKDRVPSGPLDVWLNGRGDARMSSAPDCKVNCLAALADAVASKTKVVRDVGAIDAYWPDQRWTLGMSWNNIGTDSGTATAALNLDDNELQLTVTPGQEGQPPKVEMRPYFTVINLARTVPATGELSLWVERPVNSLELRIHGEIPVGSKPWTDRVGIDDPAHYAASTLKLMLEARGVKVTGQVRVSHRWVQAYDLPKGKGPGPWEIPVMLSFNPLAALTPPPLAESVVTINKDSQNLHAQVMFRRIADIEGSGSDQWGTRAFNQLFEKAGIPRTSFDFADGSGMSTYNRVSPRATVALLRWIDTQPWGAKWHASLPIAGRDGTLKRRFVGTPLEGNLAAKTGTLNATNALSGTFRTKSGRRFTFAFFANDVPDGTTAIQVMEAVLLQIAAAN